MVINEFVVNSVESSNNCQSLGTWKLLTHYAIWKGGQLIPMNRGYAHGLNKVNLKFTNIFNSCAQVDSCFGPDFNSCFAQV